MQRDFNSRYSGGQLFLENGMARFSQITFSVPGATANMAGTYSLSDKRVKFNGKMRMKAALSQATTGGKVSVPESNGSFL